MSRQIDLSTSRWRIEGHRINHGLSLGVYREDYEPSDAVDSALPTTVRAALLSHGRIPDPYTAHNTDETRWVEDREWWFLTDFDAPDTGDGARLILRFEGITYRGEVWINGVQAGRMKGMFVTHEFDITDLVRTDRANRVAVRLRTQERASDDVRGAPIRGKIRTQGVEAQSPYGWNWCQHMVPVGIWRPVSLIVRTPVHLESLHLRTLTVDPGATDDGNPERGNAELLLQWHVRNDSDTPAEVTAEYMLAEAAQEHEAASGSMTDVIEPKTIGVIEKRLQLEDVLLWWPNGAGQPHLHRLSGVLKCGGQALDEFAERFGIRKIEMVPNEDEAEVVQTMGHSTRPWSNVGRPYPWTFTVNGRRLFMKGSNWVLLDALFRLDRERYDRQLRLVRDGGLNFLRIWGGSMAETDEFFDLCDEYGILCWQEFWLACANYPAMDHDLFIRSVRHTVRRLVNRTCLAFYSGGNEFNPDNLENRVLVDKIARAVAEEDTEREFRRGSPYKGDKHGGLVPTPLRTRNKYLDILPGESRIVLFRSEIAVGRSSPVRSSLKKFIPEESRWPLDEKLQRYYFGVPFELFQFAAEYDAMEDFEHADMANQIAHGLICRINMEFCRSRMFRCSGNLNWQFNVPWPCLHREIVDTWGVPKPAYYYYVNASRPVILMLDFDRYLYDMGEEFNPPAYVVNDGPELRDLTAVIRIYTSGSELLHEREIKISEVSENVSRQVGQLDFAIPERPGGSLLIHAELRSGERRLHSNLYWIAVSKTRAPDNEIPLAGEWQRNEETAVTLPGNDMAQPEDGFESALGLEDDAKTGGASGVVSEYVSYSREFNVRESMADAALEFYCAGFACSDEVFVNDVKIGEHVIRRPKLDFPAMCFIPAGKTEPVSAVDPDTEYPFFSDPITLPRLAPRFYDIPAGLLKPGANRITLKLKTTSQKAVPNRMSIRPRTSNRDEVSRFMRSARFFAELRRMPPAEIELDPGDEDLTVRNVGDTIALMVIVEVVPEGSDTAVPLSDNAFPLLPGESRTLRAMPGNPPLAPSTVTVYGWNNPDMELSWST